MRRPDYQPSLRRGRATTALLFLTVAAFLWLWLGWAAGVEAPREQVRAKAALCQALGVSSLALSADCTATRNMTEGICACLADMPGGYCYHTSCDTVGSPKQLEPTTYEMTIRPKPGR